MTQPGDAAPGTTPGSAPDLPPQNNAQPPGADESFSGADDTSSQQSPAEPPMPRSRRRWLPTRIRTKLVFLHTMFSLVLAVALLLALQPPLRQLLYESESHEADLVLRMYRLAPTAVRALQMDGVRIERGSAAELGLSTQVSASARTGSPAIITRAASGWLEAVEWDEGTQAYVRVSVRITEARQAISRLYLLLTLALLAVYGGIAVIVEILVLPRQVYRPIEVLLAADDAAQSGRRERELIPESAMPPDEIGRLMHSRNQTIVQLRAREAELAQALASLEEVAAELKRKNHLLETARRNLAESDRLASLGMMSAGIAHELNTPLAVIKGTVEDIAASPDELVAPERAALMLRVVRRLERLSESLLDFARTRPPTLHRVELRNVVDEAWTLVSLDRDARAVDMITRVGPDAAVLGDADRLTQVLVNLLRNAVDALDGKGRIEIDATTTCREGAQWVSLTICDDGPGIDPAILPRLFEPFASTRLDSHGTGLGLAVAEGIVREHGGVLLARNSPAGGAVFELMLPESPQTGDREMKRLIS